MSDANWEHRLLSTLHKLVRDHSGEFADLVLREEPRATLVELLEDAERARPEIFRKVVGGGLIALTLDRTLSDVLRESIAREADIFLLLVGKKGIVRLLHEALAANPEHFLVELIQDSLKAQGLCSVISAVPITPRSSSSGRLPLFEPGKVYRSSQAQFGPLRINVGHGYSFNPETEVETYVSRNGRVHDTMKPPPGPCFNCGEMHWRKECPYARGNESLLQDMDAGGPPHQSEYLAGNGSPDRVNSSFFENS